MSMVRFGTVVIASLCALTGCAPAEAPTPETGEASSPTQEAPVQLEGTAWILRAFVQDDEQYPIPEGVVVTLRFDAERATGNAGCNDYGGEYQLRYDLLVFGPLAVTRKVCPEPAMGVETRLLNAFYRRVRAGIRDEQLRIQTEGGTELVFDRNDNPS